MGRDSVDLLAQPVENMRLLLTDRADGELADIFRLKRRLAIGVSDFNGLRPLVIASHVYHECRNKTNPNACILNVAKASAVKFPVQNSRRRRPNK